MPKCDHSQEQTHAHPQQPQHYLQRRYPQHSSRSSSSNSRSMRLLLSLFIWCLVAGGSSFVCAERDFNFNDSQVPLIEPRDGPSSQHPNTPYLLQEHPYEAELSRCHYADSELLLSLVLKKHDWSEFSEPKRTKVLEQISKFFAIPKEFILMESVAKRDLTEMQAAAQHKGINKCHTSTNRRLGRVSFMLGCGSTYFTMGEPIAKQIDAQMREGYLEHLTGMKFGWWAIWRKDFNTRSQRNRRAAEGSGDVDDYYDDDDYEYDTDDDANAETATEIPAVSTHAHRHHHGLGGNSDLSANNDVSNNNINNDNNEAVVAAISVEDVDDDEDVYDEDDIEPETISSAPAVAIGKSNNGVIDDEIVESVSQLESVIRKTIKNTENVATVIDEEEEEVVVDGEDDEATATVNSVESPSQLEAELNNALVKPKPVGPTSTVSIDANLMELVTHSPVTEVTHHEHAPPEAPHISVENVVEQVASESTEPTIGSNGGGLESSSAAASSGVTTTIAKASSSSSSAAATTTATLSLANSPLLILTTTTTTSITTTPTEMPSSIHASSTSLSPDASASTIPSASTTTSSSTASPMSSTTTAPMIPSTVSPISSLSSLPSTPIQPPTGTVLLTKETDGDVTTQPEDTQNVINRAGVSNVTPQTLDPHQHAATATTPGIVVTDAISVDDNDDDDQARMSNTPPVISKRLDQFQLVGGKIFSYTPPLDTFYDTEDKTNLRWELSDEHGNELKPSSWLQFDAETREFFGIPLDSAVHKYEYRLTATDSGNESVSDLLLFGVQQHHSVRAFNHEISVTVKINEKHLPGVVWQMKLARAIASTLGDVSTHAIVVTGIQQAPHDPNTATFVYFNETLPISECPEAQLNDIVKHLDANRMSDLVYPTLGIKSITGQLTGHCSNAQLNKQKPTTHLSKNSPPEPRNQVDLVNATAGHLLIYKVPADTFYDDDMLSLVLTLKTKDHKDLSAKNWLQFDSKNQEFYGIPKSLDVGTEEYVLVAEDAGGLKATDALVVDVKSAPKREFSVYFKIFLAVRLEQFNAELQRKFVERIAQLSGDTGTQYIQLRSVLPDHDVDGTIVSFYNTTLFKLPHSRCPEEEIELARNTYLAGNVVRDRVKKELGPELGVTQVQVNSLCHPPTDGSHREFPPTKTEEPLLKSTFAHEYMYTVILPAIIIVAMILIASIVACCLHRRRHKSGKMELGDEEERKAFRTKGIPVIFQDELDEKPEIGKKSPTILKIEKPPLPPPSNHTTTAMNGDNDVDEYVPPPAVVVGGREARGKSPATPSYRKPPPYVSP